MKNFLANIVAVLIAFGVIIIGWLPTIYGMYGAARSHLP